MQLFKLPDVFLSPCVPGEVVSAGQGTWEPCGAAPTHILFGNFLLSGDTAFLCSHLCSLQLFHGT